MLYPSQSFSGSLRFTYPVMDGVSNAVALSGRTLIQEIVIDRGPASHEAYSGPLNLIPPVIIIGAGHAVSYSGAVSLVGGNIDIFAKIKVFQNTYANLQAALQVHRVGESATLHASIQHLLSKHFSASMTLVPLKYLRSSMNVFIATGTKDLSSTMNVMATHADLPATIQIPSSKDLRANVNVTFRYLQARMLMQQNTHKTLTGRMQVLPELPYQVTPVTSTLPFATWQSAASVVTFYWSNPGAPTLPVVDYIWKLTDDPDAVPDESWTVTTYTNVTIDLLAPAYGPGAWHFLVAARNNRARSGESGHYEVRYNRAPGQPGVEMMNVNNQDSILSRPLIRYIYPTTFSWSAAVDLDPGEIISYELQIALRSDFANLPGTSTPSIVYSNSSILFTSFILTEKPNPGIYYWRIRAHDGKQSGEWSQLASFRWNTPPNKPTGLTALSE